MKALSYSWPFGLPLLQTRNLLSSAAWPGVAGLYARGWLGHFGFIWLVELGVAWSVKTRYTCSVPAL